MAIRDILIYPGEEAHLRQTSVPVKKMDIGIKDLIADLKETLLVKPGAGLSAPQIGVFLRAAAVRFGQDEGEMGLGGGQWRGWRNCRRSGWREAPEQPLTGCRCATKIGGKQETRHRIGANAATIGEHGAAAAPLALHGGNGGDNRRKCKRYSPQSSQRTLRKEKSVTQRGGETEKQRG